MENAYHPAYERAGILFGVTSNWERKTMGEGADRKPMAGRNQ